MKAEKLSDAAIRAFKNSYLALVRSSSAAAASYIACVVHPSITTGSEGRTGCPTTRRPPHPSTTTKTLPHPYPKFKQVSGASGIIAEADITPAAGLPHLEKDLKPKIKVNTALLKETVVLKLNVRACLVVMCGVVWWWVWFMDGCDGVAPFRD